MVQLKHSIARQQWCVSCFTHTRIRANKAQADLLAERGHCDNLQRRRAGAPAGAATRMRRGVMK